MGDRRYASILTDMSRFISAICENTVSGLDGGVVTSSERESSMRWDSGSKPVKMEGEFTLKVDVSSTVKKPSEAERESETKEVTTSK